MKTHQCIKPGCSNSYHDNDEDAYYCPACLNEKQVVAKRLDKKFNTVGQTPNGELAAYDAARSFVDPVTGEQKLRPFPIVSETRGIHF